MSSTERTHTRTHPTAPISYCFTLRKQQIEQNIALSDRTYFGSLVFGHSLRDLRVQAPQARAACGKSGLVIKPIINRAKSQRAFSSKRAYPNTDLGVTSVHATFDVEQPPRG
eukprot:265543-Prorocentrum_minimum.AAC.1